jgi:hypothetical protein
MDTDALSVAGMSGGTATILFIAYRLFTWINHRHFRSSCNGRVVEGSIDVDTPQSVVKVAPVPSIPAETKPSS